MDEQDIREFLAGDYPRLVAGLALACGNRAFAEDMVQEALARAWERSERGEWIDSLPAWVAVVATNLLRSGLRRLRVERRARGQLAGEPTVAGPDGRSEASVDLLRALGALPRRQREAAVLFYYLDLSVAQVARALGVSEGTAKSALFRARRALAEALGEAAEADGDVKETTDHAGH